MSTDNFLMQGGAMKQKFFSFFFTIVFVGTSFSFSEAVQAGRYELIKGKGVEVCEAYKKNLESFPDPYPTMACERKINPEFKDFEKPVWEKVDLEQHRELFRRLLRYQAPERNQFRRAYYEDAELDSFIRDHKQRGYPFISRTKFPLTPYGKGVKGADDVLMYRDGACPDGPPFHASNLYLLLEDPSVKDAMIDAADRVEKLLRTEISPNNGTSTSVGLFRYKDIPYIDKYCLSRQPGCTDKETLIVFKYSPARLGFQKICEYRYLDK